MESLCVQIRFPKPLIQISQVIRLIVITIIVVSRSALNCPPKYGTLGVSQKEGPVLNNRSGYLSICQ